MEVARAPRGSPEPIASSRVGVVVGGVLGAPRPVRDRGGRGAWSPAAGFPQAGEERCVYARSPRAVPAHRRNTFSLRRLNSALNALRAKTDTQEYIRGNIQMRKG